MVKKSLGSIDRILTPFSAKKYLYMHGVKIPSISLHPFSLPAVIENSEACAFKWYFILLV
jgi:hypothetical protein